MPGQAVRGAPVGMGSGELLQENPNNPNQRKRTQKTLPLNLTLP